MGWPGSRHEQELLALSGLDEVLDTSDVASLLDREFRGMARLRLHPFRAGERADATSTSVAR